ncbi:DUF3667 domain-containing protein [Pedobacter gandavensis]|uniref:DUF3667 domain-containing protein n=1 Tax=Pedobacter gandavensis TaxID=2679963 RepID=UPI0029313EAB|nr:DUF3667 domain-containing protein [Pedobacter gandavensis]
MSGKYRKEKDCLNCGHEVEAHFCSYCGQENIVVKEDALHMVVHAVSDYFHFESKFFGTIKPLLFQPGVLTQKYVEGKRASYLHPIKLYIFISIVFFLVALGGKEEPDIEIKKDTPALKKDTTTKQVDSAKIKGESIDFYGPNIVETIKKNKDRAKKRAKKANKGHHVSALGEVLDSTIEAYEKRQLNLPSGKRDNFIMAALQKKNIKLNQTNESVEKFEDGLLHNVPKMMFLLLPLFALILKLVYFTKKKYYFEHLIYSFHVHSAIFLIVLISTLVTWLVGYVYDISELTFVLSFFWITWYIYKSLRTFYGNSSWMTILKYFLLIVCYTIAMTITLILGIGISAFMV